MGLLNKLQSRLELHRLEKKYISRRKAGLSSPSARYVDGEYIYHDPASNSSPAMRPHDIPQLTSSSSTFTATRHQTPPGPSIPVSFTSAPPTSASTTNREDSGATKHSSWQSLVPSSFGGGSGTTGGSSARNSTLTAAESPSSPALSRNSRGQNWEPPKQGWGGDGTDAFKADKKEFRFDVERDRRSIGREG